MSSTTTPSPQQRPTSQVDESQLPAGHCRYILLMPEIKGQRCGCAHFNLNRSAAGAICECGHLACYHLSNGEPPSTSENQELAMIRQRLEQLEREQVEFHQLRHEFRSFRERMGQDHDRHQEIVVRVSELEDSVERGRIDVNHEVREAYRNLGRAWDSITDLTTHKRETEEHLRQIDDHLQSIDDEVSHIGDRQLELVDVDIGIEDRIETIEDRVEVLESIEGIDVAHEANAEFQTTAAADAESRHTTRKTASPSSHPPPARSRSESPAFSLNAPAPRANMPALFAPALSSAIAAAAASSTTSAAHHSPSATSYGRELSPIRSRSTPMAMLTSAPRPQAATIARPALPSYHSSVTPPSNELWTVHVSLLPTSTQPFPFERDTNAYKRCLSRGLHQMIAVNGTSADAFEDAIQRAFGRTLRGRSWAPLQALPCTAERLAGLPMLRPLDSSLIDERCSLEFLRNHCAVCDTNGKIDSLYIAMREKTLSWHSIRRLPVFLEGLDPCWNYDTLLDKNDPRVDDDNENDINSSEDEVMGGMSRPPAGDIVATLPSLKRAASQISRSSSFSSATAATSTAASIPAAAAAEGEGSRPKVQRIYPLPNISEVRRSVKTS
ncbi:hypothetical protein F503_07258 [Ophiostoma piceae UAMH 11346]|uniref:Uncharacterized protein n=1 Tax=Ophiostoma piceae (strain UAMH 11346) TaxID=1262450 RepID=S3C9F6_OPHP1|nr:hypothetical protein F503_07258 [Ophiostoma piceae UAMH 11346]